MAEKTATAGTPVPLVEANESRFAPLYPHAEPSLEESAHAAQLAAALVVVADLVDALPAGRDRSLALTALEDVQLRAARAGRVLPGGAA